MRAESLVLCSVIAGIGCAPSLHTRELPLPPSQLARLAAQLEAKGSARDRGWFELVHRGRSSLALGHFERALRAQPGDPLALAGRALVLHDQARYREAAQAWHALLRLLRSAPTAGRFWPRDGLREALRPLALRKLAALSARGESIELTVVEAELGAAGDPLSRELARDLARRLRTRAGAASTGADAGCPASFQVSGPHGELARLELEVPASVPTRALAGAGCRVTLRSPLERGGAAGVFDLVTDVTASGSPRAVALSVESDLPWRLLVDGATSYTHDPSGRRPARRVLLALPWPRSGRARIALRVAAPAGATSLALAFHPPDPTVAFRFSAPGGAPPAAGAGWSAAPIRCAADPRALLLRAALPAWYRPVASYLAAEQAAACGDSDEVYDRVAESTREAPAFASPFLLGALSLVDDGVFPEQISIEQARRALSALLARDPALGRATYNRAILALRADEVEVALRLFREALVRWPGDGQLWAGLARVYRQRGWSADEEAALERAVSLAPGDCSLLEDLIAVKQLRRDAAAVSRLSALARRCDAGSDAVARRLREAGKASEAASEYRRLAELDPERVWLRRELASALAIAGRPGEARRELERMVADRTAGAEDLIRIADLRALAGDRAGAIAGLRRAHQLMPWSAPIRAALERLEGRSELEPYRVDGRAAIAAYRKRGRTPDAPAVLVQDRMVARIFEGGGKLTLTHNIIQVLSKEGIERWGELKLPAEAEVLTLRSIKSDGTTREPEEIAGKRSVSIPDLEVGDFVEMEYVDVERPPSGYAGTSVQTFYFASFEVPMVVSEYLVVAPRSLDLVVDRRAGAPAPERRLRGALVELRFTARDRPRMVPEPRSVSPEEYLPAVRIAAGSSWERIRDAIVTRAERLLRSAWPVREFKRRVLARASGARGAAEALYAEVTEKIAAQGPFLASAARTVASRSGSRYAALVALLREAGIAAELWLVKPRTADQAPSRIPQPAAFGVPLVYCPLERGPVFLDPRDPAVPFGYVPVELRGAPALRLARGQPALDWVPPRPEGAQDRREVRATVNLERDGTARVEVSEEVTGSVAVVLRATMRKTTPQQLRKLFEGAALAFFFPGAVLDRLEIEGARETARPLRLRYSFVTGSLAQAEAGGLKVKIGFFAPYLARIYLGLARRERAFQLANHVPTTVELRVEPPTGLQASVPSAVELRSEFGSLSRTASTLFGGGLRVRTALDVYFRRVAPKDYPAFSRFARAIDDHFQAEVRFAP